MNLSSDEKDLIARQRQEFDDLQNEIGGRSTGRRARFLPNGPGSEEAKRKEREDRAFRTRLAELLTDPIYRAKYDATLSILRDAELAVDAAFAHIEINLVAAHVHLDDIHERAARLPDGSRVYKDADGNVRREDGTLVDDVLVDTIIWIGNEPRYEDYRAATDRINELEHDRELVEGYQNDVLGPSRDRITDEENPPDLGELDDIADGIQSGMPKIVREHIPETTTVAPDVQTSSIGIPSLGG